MKTLLLCLMTYGAFVADTSIVPFLEWETFVPRLVPALLVCCVWRSGRRAGLLAAATVGLISDGLSSGPLGIELAVFVVVARAIQAIHARHPSLSTVAAPLLVAAVVFAVSIASVGLHSLVERQTVDWNALLVRVAGSAFSTAMFVAGLFIVRQFLWRRTRLGAASTHRVSNHWKMLTG